MIDGKNFFDQPVRNDLRTYDNIPTGQRDEYAISCLLEHNYFKNYYKRIAADLSKQKALDADSKAIQQINFTGSLENNAVIFSIIEEAKNCFRFFARNCKSILILFLALI